MGKDLTYIYNKEYDIILNQYDISSPLRKAHFWAQCAHETQLFTRFEENLNYSVDALLSTFGRHRISRALCYQYGRQQGKPADRKSIANTIYGGGWGKMNLGNLEWGDGWKYRGRGFIQCTGRSNYREFSDYIEIDVLSNPDLLLTPEIGLEFAAWYWERNDLNILADQDKIVSITRKINGGTLGLPDREHYYHKYKKLLTANS